MNVNISKNNLPETMKAIVFEPTGKLTLD